LFTRDVEHAGRVAGRIFALSTVGSILAAMATGYYFVPMLGVRVSCLMVAVVLGLLAALALAMQPGTRKLLRVAHAAALALLIMPATLGMNRPVPVTLGEYRLLEISNGGPYGQIKIVETDTATGPARILMFD